MCMQNDVGRKQEGVTEGNGMDGGGEGAGELSHSPPVLP